VNTRTIHFLAITVLAMMAIFAHPQGAAAQQGTSKSETSKSETSKHSKPETSQQETPHQRPGSGAAQPEPNEPIGVAANVKSDANEIRNSPSVRKLAKWTGLSDENAYWLSIFLNFAILVALLGLLSRKTLPGLFKARNIGIQKRVEEARKTGEEARERLKGVEARLSRLDVEISEMRREAEENARNEEKRVLAEAEAERQRIVTAAEQEIAAVAGNARRELKAYAAELAVNLASKKIRVGKEADQILVRDFAIELGKDGN
jgi:F-type H+-transporting ATPase subunit b